MTLIPTSVGFVAIISVAVLIIVGTQASPLRFGGTLKNDLNNNGNEGAAVHCHANSYTSKKQCEKVAGCEYCDDICNPISEGRCCGVKGVPCGGRSVNKYCANFTHCARANVSLGNGETCQVRACCNSTFPSVCGQYPEPTCYDPTQQQCCQSGVLAPADAQCCMNAQDTQAGPHKGYCPKGTSCCVGNVSRHSAPEANVTCCDDATEECHSSIFGNFCAKKNSTEACSDNLNQAQCEAQNTAGQPAKCQFCRGRCGVAVPNTTCCEVANNAQCNVLKPFGELCDTTTSVCAIQLDPALSCTEGKCCPKSKPTLCVGHLGAQCYDNTTEQCCNGRTGPLKHHCCFFGVCADPEADKCCEAPGTCYNSKKQKCCNRGEVGPLDGICCALGYCPADTTCCGQRYVKACCNSTHPVCHLDKLRGSCGVNTSSSSSASSAEDAFSDELPSRRRFP